MKRRLNILFTSDSRGVSGAELVMLDIIKNLNKDKFVSFVFLNEENKQLIEKIRYFNIEFQTSTGYPGLKQIGVSGISPLKIFYYIFGIMILYYQLSKLIKNNNIDLIWANAYPNCLFCLLPALIRKKPLIWHVHNIRKIHRLNYLVYHIAGLICSIIITVSDACKKNLHKAKIKSSKIITIYNGMDLTKLRLNKTGEKVRDEIGISRDTKVIGLFGQPIPEKGHKYFIEAASEVIKVFKDAKFLIVGHLFKSEYEKELFDLIDYFKINENVIFTGWRDDIHDVMASIDILAHTRVTPEPAALVLMEAMAMGKPIVASNNGGTPELILDKINGLVIPPSDSKALAKGIIKLLKNPTIAKQMGLNGRKRVEDNFTINKQIKSIEKLLENIIQKENKRDYFKSHNIQKPLIYNRSIVDVREK